MSIATDGDSVSTDDHGAAMMGRGRDHHTMGKPLNRVAGMTVRGRKWLAKIGGVHAVALVILACAGVSGRAQAQMGAGDGTTMDVLACGLAFEAIAVTGGVGVMVFPKVVAALWELNTVISVGISTTPLGSSMSIKTRDAWLASLPPSVSQASKEILTWLIPMVVKDVAAKFSDMAWYMYATSGAEIVKSCWRVAMTYKSAADAIMAAAYPPTGACVRAPPPAMGGYSRMPMYMIDNHQNWIDCQSTCGVSKSHSEQNTLWSLPSPPACPTRLVEGLRAAKINGYAKYCLNVCSGGIMKPESFNNCQYTPGPEAMSFYSGGSGADWCTKYVKSLEIIARSGITTP